MSKDKKVFKVYDKVWVFRNNKAKEMFVFAVVESMGFTKKRDETEKHYRLVDECCGAGWGNNEGIKFDAQSMFNNKQELIESLY
jgi:hypothetical protein